MAEKEKRIGRGNTIEELSIQGEAVKNQMDWLNKKVYGMTFEEALRLGNEKPEEEHGKED